MYSGLRQIATLPTHLDTGAKTTKKASKGMQAPHWLTRCKKARPRQVPLKFLFFLFFSGKNFNGSLAFFPTLVCGVSFLFLLIKCFIFNGIRELASLGSGFFFVEMVLIKLYTMA